MLVHPPAEPLRFVDRATALDWHEQERENLVGVTRHAADSGWHDAAWQLADSLFAFFHLRRHWADWVSVIQIGLGSAEQLRDVQAVARMHNHLGVAHKQMGHYAAAEEHYEQALDLATTVGDTGLIGAMNVNLGGLYITVGDPERGLPHLRAALTEARHGSNPGFATLTYLNLGVALVDMDRLTEASKALQNALNLATVAGDPQNACYIHNNLAEVALRQGELPTAQHHAEQQLRLADEAGDPLRQAIALDMAASCAAPTDLASARAYWRQAVDMYRTLGYRLGDALSDWLDTVDSISDPAIVAELDGPRRRQARRQI
jgi:tetratricopeptide (TPR) repeat protein